MEEVLTPSDPMVVKPLAAMLRFTVWITARHGDAGETINMNDPVIAARPLHELFTEAAADRAIAEDNEQYRLDLLEIAGPKVLARYDAEVRAYERKAARAQG